MSNSFFARCIVFCFCACMAAAQSSGTFTATGSMTTARGGHTATLLTDGRVLVAGGWAIPENTDGSLASSELYDPTAGTFTSTGSMTTNRRSHTATLLGDGRVLIAGGDSGNGAVASAELYDPSTGTFSPTGAMAKARSNHVASLLPTGKVLIAGGIDASNCYPCPAILVGAELYDPIAGTFSPTADMHVPIFEKNTAILLASGKVFIGGSQTSDLYDPANGTFTTTGGWRTIADDWPDAQALLTNGQVLVTGGNPEGFGPSTFAGLYDPGTGRFRLSGPMSAARDSHEATTLPDGTALITGGQLYDGQFSYTAATTAELYDPAIGGFTPAGSMITARFCCHTATLLNSGQVLIAGGSAPALQLSTLTSAELYNPAVMVGAPALFSLSTDGKGQGAIWDANTGNVASPSYPAFAGEVLSMYTTGLTSGGVIPPDVAIRGRLAEVLYFGDAPGYPGYNQVNFRVPEGVAAGPNVSVRLTYLGRSSNEVTMGVR